MHLKKFNIKKLAAAFIFMTVCAGSAHAYAEIRAENNAYRHNNSGIIYMKEHNYYNAALEFQIAIDLMPNSQASYAYYLNLASAYEKLKLDKEVLPCLEAALKLNPLCFDTYRKTAEWYKKTGLLDKKIKEYENLQNIPLNRVMLGVLYIQKGDKARGVTLLDNFCCEEKDLLITEGVRQYINQTVN